MQIWKIRGGTPLSGRLHIQGAKNSVLPILAASILAPCETELLNCPQLSDVQASLRILRHLGCTASQEGDTVTVDSRGLCRSSIPPELMREMRSSVLFLGAVLARCGEAKLSMPGGCELGARPVDIHLEAMRLLGAELALSGDEIVCKAPHGLRGAKISLRYPSVGATENAMLAACGAKGETVISGAAREPEICDLAEFLRALGAEISGDGGENIHIRGFSPVNRVGHRIMPDRIAGATYLCAAAAAGGDLTLTGTENAHLRFITDALREMGCEVKEKHGSVRLLSTGRLRACPLTETAPHPGFPTDAQPLLMAAALCAEGTGVFIENVFSDRYRHVPELNRLEADIRTDGRIAVVRGVKELCGAAVTATDLRGGAALVIAALRACGETVVYDAGHISRGYEAFEQNLCALGASVEKFDGM